MKILTAVPLGNFQLRIRFSDRQVGVFDGARLLQAQGSLLVALRDPAFFDRCFIELGALCWPNGLELSAARVRQDCTLQPSQLAA